MKRQGQAISHVFIFLIGAFVMAAIMLLGWRAVSTLQEQQCTAQEAGFVKDLHSALDTNLAKGKTRTIAFSLPCNADEVCFIARKVIDDPTLAASAGVTDETILASITSGDTANIFIHSNGKYEPVGGFSAAAPIAMNPASPTGIACIPGDAIEVTLQGTGQEVIISAVAP